MAVVASFGCFASEKKRQFRRPGLRTVCVEWGEQNQQSGQNQSQPTGHPDFVGCQEDLGKGPQNQQAEREGQHQAQVGYESEKALAGRGLGEKQ